ncbi:uncharacterized protein LOC130903679 [Diorhabda carinulata]|uniref:uncharacterized protein LOC130903679 n=1 Tax=Diorhabda carinulata TaxID=1163345 RepID=UPI0025A27404|nr:uncharacterized protein LOC130903679 [Diorhabda carinulata]
MHRVQRRPLKKRKDNNRRIGGKIGKNEGNITMSKRLTIPPEFFQSNLFSTNKKNKNSVPGESYSVLDSFHSIFNNCVLIRRSEKILNICPEENTNTVVPKGSTESLSLSSLKKTQSVELINSHKENNFQNNNKSNNRKGNKAIKKSKSIFEEINQLYARSHSNNSHISQVNNSTKGLNSEYSFCNSLIQQLNAAFIIEPKKILFKSKICTEIKNIDNMLRGNIKIDKTSKEANINDFYIDESGNDMKWMRFSQSEWIYNTPPRQKIIPPEFKESQLQPAVLCTNQKQKQLFEWKPNLNMDFFATKDNIVINDKYMEHTASFNRDIHNEHTGPSLNKKKIEDNMFDFPQSGLFKPHQRSNVKYDSSQVTEVNKLEKKTNFDHDMFPHCRETEGKILENYRSSPNLYLEARRRLFCHNPNTLNNDFKMDCSGSSNFDKERNNFPFLQSISKDATSDLNFNFKSSSRTNENVMFRFAPGKHG